MFKFKKSSEAATPAADAPAAAAVLPPPLDRVDVSTLLAPVSEDAPCGPDLDEEGDPDFMNYVAGSEQLLPNRYFEFDRAAADLPARIAAGEKLLERTRDARLMSILARLYILNRDVRGYVRQIVALARLMEARWETLRPAPFEGDAALRLVAVQSLDDAPTSVLPLEHAPLLRHPRLGQIAYRARLVSSGEIPPRVYESPDGESVTESHPDADAIERAMAEVDIEELIAARDLIKAAEAALASLRAASVAHVGHGEALRFDRLQPRVEGLAAWLDMHVALRDPSRADAPVPPLADAVADPGDHLAPTIAQAAAGPAGPSPAVASQQDAAAALAALDAYFSRREPSNPALLLVRQASQLVGKSYLDALRTLAPSLTDQARVALGRLEGFAVEIERLAEFSSIDPTNEVSSGDYAPSNRAEAVALMGAVTAYFARNEPSSPAPLLLERAQRMCGKDFLSILKELVPPDALKI